jgi:hypothetical protein
LKEAKTSNAQTEDETARVFERLYNPRGTGRCSDPLYRFISEYDDIVQAFFFTVVTAARIDEVRRIASRALEEDEDTFKGEQVKDTPKGEKEHLKGEAFKRVRKFSPLLSRNLVVGMANNFFSYVSEMLQHVLRRKPEALRSSERLTNEEVLQFTRVKELIAYMADKKVNELAYGGLKGVEEYVRERLGIAMFDNEDERIKLTILAELRIFSLTIGALSTSYSSSASVKRNMATLTSPWTRRHTWILISSSYFREMPSTLRYVSTPIWARSSAFGARRIPRGSRRKALLRNRRVP